MITCPVCGETTEPKVSIRTLSICGHCGASLAVADDGTVTRATRLDTEGFDTLEMSQLVRARASIARPERRR